MIKLILSLLLFLFASTVYGQSNEFLPFRDGNGKWSFVDIEGKSLTNTVYDSVIPFQGLGVVAQVQLNGKWGAINKKGETVVPVEFNTLSYTTDYYNPSKYVIAEKDKKVGVYDVTGLQILPVQFRKVTIIRSRSHYMNFPIGFAAQRIDTTQSGSVGIYNLIGSMVLPHDYCTILEMSNPDYNDYHLKYNTLVGKRTKDGNVLMGAYNLDKRFWLFPCDYNLKNFDAYHYYGSQYNPTRLVPIGEGTVYHVPDTIMNGQYTSDFWTEDGKFLFNSGIFESVTGKLDSDDKTKFYVAKSVIIGKTNPEPYIKPVSDSLKRYILQCSGTFALYDMDKGFLIEPGTYTNISFESKYYFNLMTYSDTGSYSMRYDLDGNLLHVHKFTDKRLEALKVTDENNLEIDMKPYEVTSTVSGYPKNEEYYIAKKGEKFGLTDNSKKELIPFKYDRLSYNKYLKYFYATEGYKSVLYNLEFEKILTFEGTRWESFEDDNEDRLKLIPNKSKVDVYDLKAQRFLLKNQKYPSKLVLDTLSDFGIDILPRAYWLNDSVFFFQLYSSSNGWSFYNQLERKYLLLL